MVLQLVVYLNASNLQAFKLEVEQLEVKQRMKYVTSFESSDTEKLVTRQLVVWVILMIHWLTVYILYQLKSWIH